MASTPSSKPFGIQSPEQIAKDYGGNKQKIAEAMQLGIVDPTIGTLAGMFIDRMAAGAAQGQAPQSTVAAQVFNPQTPPAQAPGGVGPGAPPMGMGPPPPDMGMGMGAPPPDMGMGMGAPPPDMGMGAPPPDMPMPPPSPEAMQPMGPGMADGGMVAFRSGGPSSYGPTESIPERSDVVNKYRLPPMREERHNNLLDLVHQFMNVDRRVGDANIRGQYDPIRNTSNYGVDVPVAGGNFSAGAHASRGVRPDSYNAGYSHRLLGGDAKIGGRYDRNGRSVKIEYTRKLADGGMVAFAQGGESRPLDLQSLLPFPEAGLPEEAGFADGGVASLPVPDDMFNSSVGDSDMQQYADGGMVAFAAGDEVLPEGPLGPYFEEQVRALYPDAIIAGRGRTAARNREVGGVPNSYHLTNNALDLKPPKGMSLTEFGSSLRKHFGPQVDTIFNTKGHYDHVHLEPSKIARRGTSRAAPDASAGLASAVKTGTSEETRAVYDMMRAETAQRNEDRAADIAELMKDRAADKRDRKQAGWAALAQQGLAMMSPQGAGMPSLFADGGTVPGYAVAGPVNNPFSRESLAKSKATLEELRGPQSREFSDMLMANTREDLANNRTERKQAANMALMNFGLALMASKNPNFLGAIGEAGAPAVAGMKADLRDLKKEARASIMDAAQLEGLNNKERNELASATLTQATNAANLANEDRKFNEDVRQANATLKLRRDELNATIAAAKSKGIDVDTAVFAMFRSGDPAMQAAAKEWIALHHPPSGSGEDAAQRLEDIKTGRHGGGSGGTAEGARAKDSDGKTIVFSNGQWMYP